MKFKNKVYFIFSFHPPHLYLLKELRGSTFIGFKKLFVDIMLLNRVKIADIVGTVLTQTYPRSEYRLS